MFTNIKKHTLEKYNTHSLSNIVNQWMAILLCIWMIWPYFNYKLGILFFLAFFVLWFFTTDYYWLFEKWTLDLILVLISFISLVPYIITGNFKFGSMDPKTALISMLLFIIGVFINHYYMFYKRDFVFLGRIAFISLFMYLIGSIQTYYGLKEFPLASRMLATTNDPLQHVHMSLGIGGFGFVYSLVFVVIISLYFIKSKDLKKVYKILFMLAVICFVLTIIEASYAIALILLSVGILLVISIKGKKSFIIGLLIALVFILLIPKAFIGDFLLNIAHFFKSNDTLYNKFLDLGRTILGDSMGSQTEIRGHLYLTSLKTFLENPLFGIYGPLGDQLNGDIGGHSGWLDFMAMYGVFGAFPLFSGVLLNFKKLLLFYSGSPYYIFILISQMLFICFGFLNPVIYIYQIGFVLFVIAPSLPFLPYAFSKSKVTINNNI